MNELTIGSLFSGIGGIELGFERTRGFKTSWFVENDAYCQAILKERFPDTEIYGDITTLDFSTVQRPDILTGGFPCQDISNAGRRAGITGSRSSLWHEYLKAIRILRPKYAVIENVAALTRRGLNVVLAGLAEIGYDAEWYNLSASCVGAPHKRERLFIIAYPRVVRCVESESEDDAVDGGEQALNAVAPSSYDVSNTTSIRCGGRICVDRKNDDRLQKYSQEQQSILRCEAPRCHEDDRKQYLWSFESPFCGVVDGIPRGVDSFVWKHRIHALGNAVVPQVAEVIAQAILEYGTRGLP